MKNIKIISLLILLFWGLSCASVPQSEKRNTHIKSAQTFVYKGPANWLLPPEINLWFNTQKKPLGAYSVTLLFDPNIIQVRQVLGGNKPFDGPPYVNRRGFSKGRLKFMAFHTEKNGPKGQILVARIQFRGVRPGISNLQVLVETLATPEGKPLTPRFLISSDRVEVIRYDE